MASAVFRPRPPSAYAAADFLAARFAFRVEEFPGIRCAVSLLGGCNASAMTTENSELLRRYVADRSESAFASLVERHLDLVYSAALRQVSGDTQAAQDVTQAVFCDLARQAPRLTRHPSLTGWLYTSTRYLAAKARRTEQRRRAREQQAHAMNQLLQTGNPDPAWQELRPVLDDAMHELNAADREAVLLRYFEKRPLAEIGARLGLTENAARMRVDRAVDKLRAVLAKRGVTSTAAALAASLAQHTVGAAPAGLAAQVTRAALTVGAAGGGFLAAVQSFFVAKAPVLVGAAAVAVVAVGIWLAALRTPPDNSLASAGPASPAITPAAAGTATAEAGTGPVIGGESAVASGDQLLLDVVTADTGKPVPNARIEYWLWEGKEVARKTLWADRFGKCAVPVPRGSTTHLILVSQCDGFADTRLDWRPDRGEAIPDRYTLRVARSVPIGGRAVDADGQPVAGAEVGFNNQTNSAKETRPQTDNFVWPFWVTATTDVEGRWRIDRIAEATLRTIDGGARHPEHVRSDSVSGANPEALRQLREGRYVFRLGRAVTVRGLVVDTADQPVPGAKVLVGIRDEVNSREATTQADGTFQVAGCKPGRGLLSAEAPGFAPTTREVELTADAEPFRLTLAAGRLLRLRVVDSRGFPVPQANVWLNTSPYQGPGARPGQSSPVQIEFHRQTDAEGRVEWDTAPDQDLDFGIAASGYMRASHVKVRPDGMEHEVVLKPALTISGTVRDAASGEPVRRFRIVTGWPTPNLATGATNATWSNIDRFWLSFEGGRFRHVFEEPVLGGVKEPAFVFKFEAEGYVPFVTRVVRADEGEAQFDVRLRAGAATAMTVLLPDGRPAVNADIGLVSPGAGLRLIPGGFSRENLQSGGSLLTTDGQGQFRLPPDDAVARVIAAHPGGFAETTPAVLAAEPVIRLQAWGRLEGTYLSRGQPAADRELLFQYGQGDFTTVSSDSRAYQVRTDRDGRFVFPQVPPGQHRLVRLVPEKGLPGMSSGTVWSHQPLLQVDIRPGDTTTVTIGGTSYTVRARLQWPADLPREANWRVVGVVRTPVLPAPEETRNSPQALAAWRNRPEVRGAFAGQRFFPLAETTDGTWVAEDVPAGSYVLFVGAVGPGETAGQFKERARAEVPVVVPADPPSGVLDLGEIPMVPTP